eukprot:m.68602 g.68602  ORF g.68602 m.68602 type:complete len:89 (+) comp23975_c0_seq2:1484-1750(+)
MFFVQDQRGSVYLLRLEGAQADWEPVATPWFSREWIRSLLNQNSTEVFATSLAGEYWCDPLKSFLATTIVKIEHSSKCDTILAKNKQI